MNTLYHPHLDPSKTICNDLPDTERKHLRSLRANAGEQYRIVDGNGTAVVGCLKQFDRDSCIIDHLEPAPSYEPESERILVLGKLAQPKLDAVVESLTPLGLSKLLIIETEYTQPFTIRTDRLSKIAETAMKQCRRSKLPQIINGERGSGLKWTECIAFLEYLSGEYSRLVADQSGKPIHTLPKSTTNNNIIAIGPEGGFTANETKQLLTLHFIPVTLGDRILRAELASIVTFANLL